MLKNAYFLVKTVKIVSAFASGDCGLRLSLAYHYNFDEFDSGATCVFFYSQKITK